MYHGLHTDALVLFIGRIVGGVHGLTEGFQGWLDDSKKAISRNTPRYIITSDNMRWIWPVKVDARDGWFQSSSLCIWLPYFCSNRGLLSRFIPILAPAHICFSYNWSFEPCQLWMIFWGARTPRPWNLGQPYRWSAWVYKWRVAFKATSNFGRIVNRTYLTCEPRLCG